MIREIEPEDIPACVHVIKTAFSTVARELGITAENAPRFTAFATNEERLQRQYRYEHRQMFVFCENGKIVGYYSLLLQENEACELNNLCVLPEYRHQGIGAEMLKHAFQQAVSMGCTVMNIGIVEDNQKLRLWYESFDFVHQRTQKFDFFPFTCGYMRKSLK